MMYIMVPVCVTNALYAVADHGVRLYQVWLDLHCHRSMATQEAHRPPTANACGTDGEETARHVDKGHIVNSLPKTEGDGENTDLEWGTPKLCSWWSARHLLKRGRNAVSLMCFYEERCTEHEADCAGFVYIAALVISLFPVQWRKRVQCLLQEPGPVR